MKNISIERLKEFISYLEENTVLKEFPDFREDADRGHRVGDAYSLGVNVGELRMVRELKSLVCNLETIPDIPLCKHCTWWSESDRQCNVGHSVCGVFSNSGAESCNEYKQREIE